MMRIAVKASGAAITGCFGYGYYLLETDEGAKRAFKAYNILIPVVLHYRFAEKFRNMSEDDWADLDERYAVSTVSELGKLQGMYCKYCQSAAGFTNTFSTAWVNEFRKLESNVPPRPVEAVYKTIEEETGAPVEKTFKYFDPIPLGSASIGQVHKAILHDGREVAVKVQYAEAQELFQNDVHIIRSFCERFAPEHIVLLEAIEKSNKEEVRP